MVFIAVIVVLAVIIAGYMQLPMFGALPNGARKDIITRSPNYREGKMQNLNKTPDLSEGVGYSKIFRDMLFGKHPDNKPKITIPSKKTDLITLSRDKDILVWFGHSSYFIQVDGKRFLVDPVFSGNASPIPGSMKSFTGSDVYTPADIPEIDVLFLSHDHYDHLDHDTIVQLRPKIKKVITGLGTGAHLQRWGYADDVIIEKDWNEEVALGDGFTVNTLPARHFSGRSLKRQQALWLSFALRTPTMNLFLGGDSGYDTHFKTIGDKFGPFDLVILECGQYNDNWKYIHSMPEEVVTEAQELRAKKLLPVHWAKFALATHAWTDPIERVTAAAKKEGMPIVTPMIGESLNLKGDDVFSDWWR